MIQRWNLNLDSKVLSQELLLFERLHNIEFLFILWSMKKKLLWLDTLDYGIDVAPGINVALGTFGKNIKNSPWNRHPQYYWTEDALKKKICITPSNKERSPGKKVQKLISIPLCLFRSLEYSMNWKLILPRTGFPFK